MSTEAVMDMILNTLKDIKKDINDVKTKQIEQEKIVSELQKAPIQNTSFNGQSVQQMLSKLDKGNYQELTKIERDLNTTVDMILKYGKAIGISK